MTGRSAEDRLREQYQQLLPELKRDREKLEIEIRHALLPLQDNLQRHERIEIVSRIKDCDSAIKKLRDSQEAKLFDPNRRYSLTTLNDLVGVKVFVFPRKRLRQVDAILRVKFTNWDYDPFKKDGERLGYKYIGEVTARHGFRVEYQVVSALAGKYLEVEHDAVYKPGHSYSNMGDHDSIRQAREAAFAALTHFDKVFEQTLADYEKAASEAAASEDPLP